MTGIYRQGDVLLVPITRIPDNLKPVPAEHGRLVLMRGEATGHHHSVAVADAEILVPEGLIGEVERYLRVRRATNLTHQEHAAIILPPGNYAIRRQFEYQPERAAYVSD